MKGVQCLGDPQREVDTHNEVDMHSEMDTHSEVNIHTLTEAHHLEIWFEERTKAHHEGGRQILGIEKHQGIKHTRRHGLLIMTGRRICGRWWRSPMCVPIPVVFTWIGCLLPFSMCLDSGRCYCDAHATSSGSREGKCSICCSANVWDPVSCGILWEYAVSTGVIFAKLIFTPYYTLSYGVSHSHSDLDMVIIVRLILCSCLIYI